MREAKLERVTRETNIKLNINLDGMGILKGGTGIAFLDHMLELWCCHSGCSISVQTSGDYDVDFHHTVEDIGICLGQAFSRALGDKKGINRYGASWIPMDEALIMAVIDISGRPYLNFDVSFENEKVGDFDVELIEEFLKAFSNNAGVTLHFQKISGKNTHHIAEAVFKSFARAVKEAAAVVENEKVPSTKGMI